MTQITRNPPNNNTVAAKVVPKQPAVSEGPQDESEISINARDSLGAALTKQRRFDEAEAVLRENLRVRDLRKAQGKDDSERIGTLNNLAAVLDHTDRHAEAELMYRNILDLFETKLGDKHRDIVIVKSNLCQSLRHQGKIQEAEELMRETVQLSREALGPEAPETLSLTDNLGSILHHQQKYDAAEPLLRQVLEARKKLHRESHPDTAVSMNHLAATLNAQGKKDEAEALYGQTIENCETDDDRLLSMSKLALMLKGQGRYAEAETMYRRALALSTHLLGPEDRETRSLMAEFGDLLIRHGKFAEAEDILRAAAK